MKHPMKIEAEDLMSARWMLSNAIDDYEAILKKHPEHPLFLTRIRGCKRALKNLEGAERVEG